MLVTPPSLPLRFAERQHQPVRPGEHRDRIGEVGDVGIGEAGAAQGSGFGGAGLRRRLRELGGEVRAWRGSSSAPTPSAKGRSITSGRLAS